MPHLQNSTIAAFDASASAEKRSEAVALSDALIAELKAADHVLISSPLYNFTIPSTLKAYIDHVVRSGQTFDANERGYVGLLKGKSACIVTACGGSPSAGGADVLDFQGPYLTAVLKFMGFDTVDLIAIEGTSDEGTLKSNVARAHAQIDRLSCWEDAMAQDDNIQWIGAFTAEDREEIEALRAAQMAAIARGDAEAYGRLCTDDILLMLQGHDVVGGRNNFLECESALFRATKFQSLRQLPIRVERRGELAVEVGRQETVVAPDSAEAEAFKARRKYTHVLRQTPEGWRFAVLMSNNSV